MLQKYIYSLFLAFFLVINSFHLYAQEQDVITIVKTKDERTNTEVVEIIKNGDTKVIHKTVMCSSTFQMTVTPQRKL